MPKMQHVNSERPLSVLPEDVESYASYGWTIVGAEPEAEPESADEPAVEVTAVTRKSVAKKPARRRKK